MNVTIRSVRPEDRDEWLRMREALWEDCPDDQQVREMEDILASDTEEVFVAERTEGGLCGFVEAALRSRADGCDSTPVGYTEGW
jgi:aminoglycoside 6'-N-acetyltransferase I